MKKVMFIFVFILFITLLIAEEIDPNEKYIVTGAQLLNYQQHIVKLQWFVYNLENTLTEKKLEIVVLKSEVEKWKLKYERSRKGFWTGIGSGYPLGAQGVILYQFNEQFGLFVIGGYNSLWSINAGFIARVK